MTSDIILIDLRQVHKGPEFHSTGGRIITAIQGKIASLNQQSQDALEALQTLLPDETPESAILLLAIFAGAGEPSSLSPKAASIWRVCKVLDDISKEIGSLQLFMKNLTPSANYKLGLEECERFGL